LGKIKAYMCPRCGSLKVKPLTSLSGVITPQQYICEKCGYISTIFLLVEIDAESERICEEDRSHDSKAERGFK